MCAKYTETLRDLMLNEQSRIHIDKALSTYPLYEPKKLYDMIPSREELNEKLLNHYKYREIGFETFGRFVDELEITMKEIMPHYNELFKTVEIMADIEDPFGNVDVTETFKQTVKGDSSSSGTASNTASGTSTNTNSASGNSENNSTAYGKSVESDTPQDQVSIGAKGINEVDYASSAGWTENEVEGSSTHTETSEGSTSRNDTSETSTSESTESNSTTEHTFHKKGNQGVNTYAHDMNEFRTSIIDVIEQILNDQRIAELFMMVY